MKIQIVLPRSYPTGGLQLAWHHQKRQVSSYRHHLQWRALLLCLWIERIIYRSLGRCNRYCMDRNGLQGLSLKSCHCRKSTEKLCSQSHSFLWHKFLLVFPCFHSDPSKRQSCQRLNNLIALALPTRIRNGIENAIFSGHFGGGSYGDMC